MAAVWHQSTRSRTARTSSSFQHNANGFVADVSSNANYQPMQWGSFRTSNNAECLALNPAYWLFAPTEPYALYSVAQWSHTGWHTGTVNGSTQNAYYYYVNNYQTNASAQWEPAMCTQNLLLQSPTQTWELKKRPKYVSPAEHIPFSRTRAAATCIKFMQRHFAEIIHVNQVVIFDDKTEQPNCIPFEDWILMFLRNTRIPLWILLKALVLLRRVRESQEPLPAGENQQPTISRPLPVGTIDGAQLFMVAVMISTKVSVDNRANVKEWLSRTVNKWSVQEINFVEKSVLFCVDWNIQFERDELEALGWEVFGLRMG